MSDGSPGRFRIASRVGRRLEVVDQSRRDIHQEFVGLSHGACRLTGHAKSDILGRDKGDSHD